MAKEMVRERGVNMSGTMWRNIRVLAAKTDRTASDVIREAIADYLQRHGIGRRKQQEK